MSTAHKAAEVEPIDILYVVCQTLREICQMLRLAPGTAGATYGEEIAMAKMTAMQAAVHVLESEGVKLAFGVPGSAILPLYDALRKSSIRHVLVRHEEGGTHAAEGYTRAAAGRIGVCIGTSGPAGTNMVTG